MENWFRSVAYYFFEIIFQTFEEQSLTSLSPEIEQIYNFSFYSDSLRVFPLSHWISFKRNHKKLG